ncbi:hypothetical protein M409DRAFT_67348 [Zasmidium cellare ATCC 36951]|uniref:Enoyl reductase (ER) domain-containing protein n=1 Tax=Zasmidium cellare ATCC 36951 TaxID=1080233 RepID=A0A6A6CCV9_ZASCE|nr:uncharacterized protein M409DRAFT_67348 [Zasmidium cellare ATCC 36951]KAF2165037.1 hypothetical protein M409DRAFT_67348 [Zasmidium cellare ATCC 36951]
MKALTLSSKHGPPLLTHRPLPRLRPTYLLVRVHAVALNPADIAVVDWGLGEADTLLGCDYAGVVEAVGSEVHRDFKVGERVCGAMRPADPHERENGCFAEWVVVKADIAWRVPEGLGWEEAATLGVTGLTTGRCMYQKFKLPWPDRAEKNPGWMFIYGGSSAMGTMLTQFAKLSNYEVITTCSPQNFELCKSFGAAHIFDYHDPETPKKILDLVGDSLNLCVDCISTEETGAFCAKVLAPKAKYSASLVPQCPREDVEMFSTPGFSFMGEPWEQFGVMNPASMEDFEYSKGFAILAERLLAEGKVRPHPVDLREGGLEAIPEAMEDLRAKRVSGKKLVFRVRE